MKKVATDFAQALDQMIIHGTNIPQSIHQNPKLRSLKLMFLRKVFVPVFTGKEIKRVGGSAFDVALIDVNNGEIVESAPEASVTVEIVVLRGDFGGDNWISEEFNSNIVRHREDVNKPLFQEQYTLD
ncbi:hypothetical protein KY290_025492 [Solanum tuberosum]|uniref:Calmodulin binding protein-like N-terminal domain-containing protein n=1 Tax=Solanum tuberosum TaxID=4113 RepID=A0ABQ7UTR3_SOLTU|nr:hypothetical protein KY290_025492 [Solanum tuberosum]